MGQPKALLPIYQTTFLGHILAIVKDLGFPIAKVVLGHEAEQIRQRAGLSQADVVINPRYLEGQLSSLQAVIRHLSEWGGPVSGLLVCLVDHPLIDRTTVRHMTKAFAAGTHPIIIPTYGGRRGHPVIFSRALFPELMDAPPEQGAKAVVWKAPERVLELETDNDEILVDIDTPEKYAELCRRLRGV